MSRKRFWSASLRCALGLVMAASVTGIAYAMHFNLASATSLHLFLITVIALQWGLLEASVVSIFSVVCLDYFFTTPLFQLYMTDAHDWVALITFESVALLVSRLSNQINRHAKDAETHRGHLQKLYRLSEGILLLDRQQSVSQPLTDLIRSSLDADGIVLWNSYDARTYTAGGHGLNEAEMLRAQFAEKNEDDFASGTSFRVLRSGTRAIGSLTVQGHSLDASTINTAASLVAVAIERARSFSIESKAEAARQSEQLRSTVLDGLAHAFKTPLTTIRSSSSGLIEMNTLSGAEKSLVVLIDEQAEHLNELTTRLLRTARIDTADLILKRERIDLTQLVEDSVSQSSREFYKSEVSVRSKSRSMVWADRQLLKMALFQLLDNAAKYGDTRSLITVEIEDEQAETLISVQNQGSFIPLEERQRIFQRFYRSPGSDRRAPGTGIGLSVVKHVTEAHKGRVWVKSDPATGTTFFMSLPRVTKEA